MTSITPAMTSWLSPEHKQAVLTAEGCATGLPNPAYTSDEFFHWERDNLFPATWASIGNDCDIPEPGWVKPVNFFGMPLVLVRTSDQKVKVYHNVCSHRGNAVVWEAGQVGNLIRCPYHSWAYDLDGNLRATPHVGGVGKNDIAGFTRARHGLREVRSATWMGLVFVNLSGQAPDFADFIAPLQQRFDALGRQEEFANLQPATTYGRLTIEFNGNWKLCVENNLESYHLPWVHPKLNAISRLEDHHHFYAEHFAGQCSQYDHSRLHAEPFPHFTDWPDKVAEYPTLYPNTLFGLHCDHYWTRVIEPVGPATTRDHLQLYYLGDAAMEPGRDAARKAQMDAWRDVFYEDIGVVEGMQRGRYSPAFAGGVFTPVMDEPSHHFARWMAERL